MHIPYENAIPVLDSPLAKGLRLLTTENTEFVELTLQPEGCIPAHSLDIPVSFYVAEGTGTMALNSNGFFISKGDMVTSEAGSTRELTNTGEGNLRILVIKHVGNDEAA